jgi:DNA-binding transcriptional regulator YiaG
MLPMPNIAAVLKAEIARVARKEVRGAVDSLRKATTGHRSEVAALKRRLQELERQVKKQPRPVARPQSAADAATAADSGGLRFRAAGMAKNRERLGLSAREFGLLVGVSAQAINAWEQGKAKPVGEQLAVVASLRGVTKAEAAERLAAARAT